MFFQLGNIVFQNLFSPHSWETEGDEAVYAEHELLGGKPRLQKTGDTLQQVTLECKFHAEFCNPQQQLEAIKKEKDAGTVLPMISGNGKYVNDYVIISYPYKAVDFFADGTLKEAIVTLTIREYVAYNLLEQQRLAARKSAFALGDKNPVVQRPGQPPGTPKIVAMAVSAVMQQTKITDSLVSDFLNNPAERQSLGTRIKEGIQKAQDNISELNANLDKAREIDSQFNQIRSDAGSVYASAAAIAALFPVTDLDGLQQANTILQADASGLSTGSAGLMKLVATRQPVPETLGAG